MVIVLLIFAYILGSIPTGKILARRWYDIDIQQKGSGNIGFANVRRVLGWKPAIVVLIVDITKGFLPTLLALQLTSVSVAYWVGIAAIIGHILPIWLRFRGGKGIATGLGMLASLVPLAAAAGVVVYLILGALKTPSSFASIAGTLVAALSGSLLGPVVWWQCLILVLIAGWTLRNNIRGTLPAYDI